MVTAHLHPLTMALSGCPPGRRLQRLKRPGRGRGRGAAAAGATATGAMRSQGGGAASILEDMI